MHELMKKQVEDDYKEVLSTDAGKRLLGGIFYAGGLNKMAKRTDFEQGIFTMALIIANTVRDADPLGVAKCEIAYKELKERFNDEDDGRHDNDTYRAELTD